MVHNCEEAQDIDDQKIRKSIEPMTASTLGSIVKVGTAGTRKCDFYTSIQDNRRNQLLTGKRNHFYFPWTVCSKSNSLYRTHVENARRRLGAESDEFLMSYMGKWIFERGMFISSEQLFHPEVAQVSGVWSKHYDSGYLPVGMRHYSIVAGIDWGSMADSTYVCLMAVDWNNPVDSMEQVFNDSGTHRYVRYKKHIIGWLSFRGDNYETQWHEISSRLSRIPQLRKIIMDSNTCGLPIYDRFCSAFIDQRVAVEGFNFHSHIKSEGYKSFANDFHAQRITFPAGKEARETAHYREFVFQTLDLRKDYKNGLMVVSHPDEKGAHDDAPDSAMIAAWGCNDPAHVGTEFARNNPFC